MINITPLEKKQITSIIQDARYDTVIKFADELMNEWKSVGVKGETEFETIWRTATREAKVDALKEFLEKLERLE
jgi:hypothetical protein